ncbi:MAG: uracil-DNA glycosylase [Clostridiales bacterium]|nr:uracil-DNA glycosylase [Clostridiales bacterium]
MVNIGNDWDEILAPLFENEKYLQIRSFLAKEYREREVYPSMYDIFNSFKIVPYKSVKAVILGQDPYHEPNQAHGLCFSVKEGVKLPPSLVNIYKEIKSDLGITEPNCGDLTKWAEEGILLLNTTLTVRRGQANSHKDCGWTWFTDEVIKLLSKREKPIVFILWGGNARSKKSLIDKNKHFIIESAHPSPLSAYNGFFGSKPFSKTNDFLKANGVKEIDWDLNKH